jgi:hypothetical protein
MPRTDRAFPTPSDSRQRTHRLVFDDPRRTLEALRALRAEGFDVDDVYTPYAVHGMDEVLGLPESRLGLATFAGGLAGCVIAFGFQIWTHAIDWPLIIGGKSPLALPAQVPVSFEITILFAALATVGALLVRRRLFPRLAIAPPGQPSPAVTDDRFVILVVERDGSFPPSRLGEIAVSFGAVEPVEAWRVP